MRLELVAQNRFRETLLRLLLVTMANFNWPDSIGHLYTHKNFQKIKSQIERALCKLRVNESDVEDADNDDHRLWSRVDFRVLPLTAPPKR